MSRKLKPATPFAERLVQARGDRSRQEVAEALGCPVSTLANYEQGRTFPDQPMLAKMRDVLGVSLDWLLTGEVEEAGDDLFADGGFGKRLRIALGDESPAAFVARYPSLSEQQLKLCLAGGLPSVPKVVFLAVALGVAVDWLLTGRGPMHLPDPDTVSDPRELFDEVLLGHISGQIFKTYIDEDARITAMGLVGMSAKWYVDLVRHFPPGRARGGAQGHAPRTPPRIA